MSNLDLHPENNDIFLYYSRLPYGLRHFQTSAGTALRHLARSSSRTVRGTRAQSLGSIEYEARPFVSDRTAGE